MDLVSEASVMSTVIARPAGKVKLTVAEYKTIVDTGVFDGRHVQLLDGELFEVTKHPPHSFTVCALAEILRTLLGGSRWAVREEKPIAAWAFWWPEPDIVVARGSHRQYQSSDPRPQDIVFLVEICDTSQYEDRIKKLQGYAKVGISQYWIVDLGQRVVEVYTKPLRSGRPPRYAECSEYLESGAVPVVIGSKKFGTIPVADILPARTKNQQS
jgi:Uma2 family endonuclease